MLSNKYRPKKFADLIGQEILVETIKNAISLNRIANAFLLTGSHGIGKTSAARLIAMLINCEKQSQENCGKCESCIAIEKSCHPDILEIDAASHTGVDDVREIIDNACYLPVSAKYRVYIIDEVHMLSGSAFNALLKLLEEPPEHIKFIFATTEKKKLPLTIISRCQHFALKRLSIDILTQHLSDILLKENVTAEHDALKMIANFANGSARDALSLLDQVIAYSQSSETITLDNVKKIFGVSDKMHLLNILKNLLGGRLQESLLLFKELYDAGNEPTLALQNLLEILHLLIRLKLDSDYESFEYSANAIKEANLLASSVSLEFLNRAWQVLAKGSAEMVFTSNYYMTAEILLIRISCLSNLPSPAEAVRNIELQPLSSYEFEDVNDKKFCENLGKTSTNSTELNSTNTNNKTSTNSTELNSTNTNNKTSTNSTELNSTNTNNKTSTNSTELNSTNTNNKTSTNSTELNSTNTNNKTSTNSTELNSTNTNNKTSTNSTELNSTNTNNKTSTNSTELNSTNTNNKTSTNSTELNSTNTNNKTSTNSTELNSTQFSLSEKDISAKDIYDISNVKRFDDLILLCKRQDQVILSCYLKSNVRMLNFTEGFVELLATDVAAGDYINKNLAKYLQNWTKKQWKILVKYDINSSESEFLLKFNVIRNIIELFNCSVHEIILVK